jgi:hypothetical protein
MPFSFKIALKDDWSKVGTPVNKKPPTNSSTIDFALEEISDIEFSVLLRFSIVFLHVSVKFMAALLSVSRFVVPMFRR